MSSSISRPLVPLPPERSVHAMQPASTGTRNFHLSHLTASILDAAVQDLLKFRRLLCCPQFPTSPPGTSAVSPTPEADSSASTHPRATLRWQLTQERHHKRGTALERVPEKTTLSEGQSQKIPILHQQRERSPSRSRRGMYSTVLARYPRMIQSSLGAGYFGEVSTAGIVSDIGKECDTCGYRWVRSRQVSDGHRYQNMPR